MMIEPKSLGGETPPTILRSVVCLPEHVPPTSLHSPRQVVVQASLPISLSLRPEASSSFLGFQAK
jgi:hypothetical protein